MTKHYHCYVCTEGHKPICCGCGDALVPWHPEIQWKYIDGEV